MRPIPPPVWPSKAHHAQLADKLEPLAPSALVEQNKNYVTKILIAPRASGEQAAEETFDSIVTDSLLKWTSYGGHEDNGCDPEPAADPANRAETGADAVRQLSLSLGKRRVVASVSRAFSKSGRVSSETYAAAGHVSRPADQAAGRASEIAKRISPTAQRPVEEEVEVTYQRLDQRYVPRNGDANYSASRRTDPSLNGSMAPFSYLAGHHVSALRGNQQWDEDRLHDFHHCEIPTGDRGPLEHDRQSNSSSRSSGSSSRRVTFSADTVDNEPSNQSSGSTAVASQESSSAGSSPAPELALDPHYLPYRYHLPGSMGANHPALVENGRLAGYYTYNLKSHSGFYYKQR